MILFYLCLLLSLLLVKAKTDTKQEARLMKKLIASIVSKCQAWPAIFLFFTFINFWLVFLVAFFSKLIFYCSNFGIDIPCPFLSRKTNQIIGRSNFVWKSCLPPLTHPIFNETKKIFSFKSHFPPFPLQCCKWEKDVWKKFGLKFLLILFDFEVCFILFKILLHV